MEREVKEKILVFGTKRGTPWLETGIELANLNAEEGKEVHYINVGWQLPYSLDKYKLKTLGRSIIWKEQKAKVKRVLNKKVKFHERERLSWSFIKDVVIPQFEHIEDVKKFTFKGLDVGMSAASTLITFLNDLNPDVKKFRSKLIEYIYIFIAVYIKAEEMIKKFGITDVYLFNGRFADVKPIVRACENLNIKFHVYDRGHHLLETYSLYDFHLHDYVRKQQHILDHWEKSEFPYKELLAEKFFIDNRLGLADGYVKNFTKFRKVGNLPASWDNARFNVVFFSTSIAEYAAISDKVNPHKIFASQHEAVQEFSEYFRDKPNTAFYVRLHPNLLRKGKQEIIDWKEQSKQDPFTEFIQPDDAIDSYALMDAANLVITYGSSTGVECVYWGTPSICVANSMHSELKIAHVPDTKEELWKLLDSESIEPLKEDLFKYAYFMMSFGIPFRDFKASGQQEGKYLGIDLNNLVSRKLIQKFVTDNE